MCDSFSLSLLSLSLLVIIPPFTELFCYVFLLFAFLHLQQIYLDRQAINEGRQRGRRKIRRGTMRLNINKEEKKEKQWQKESQISHCIVGN